MRSVKKIRIRKVTSLSEVARNVIKEEGDGKSIDINEIAEDVFHNSNIDQYPTMEVLMRKQARETSITSAKSLGYLFLDGRNSEGMMVHVSSPDLNDTMFSVAVKSKDTGRKKDRRAIERNIRMYIESHPDSIYAQMNVDVAYRLIMDSA